MSTTEWFAMLGDRAVLLACVVAAVMWACGVFQ